MSASQVTITFDVNTPAFCQSDPFALLSAVLAEAGRLVSDTPVPVYGVALPLTTPSGDVVGTVSITDSRAGAPDFTGLGHAVQALVCAGASLLAPHDAGSCPVCACLVPAVP